MWDGNVFFTVYQYEPFSRVMGFIVQKKRSKEVSRRANVHPSFRGVVLGGAGRGGAGEVKG